MTGGQATQMVKAGLKAIYLSGWQVAADANLAGQMYPDQSLYPANSVPMVVKRINAALQRADQIDHMEGTEGTHWFAPILRVPATLALRKRVLPLCKLSDQVSVACADPEDEATLRQLVRFLDCDVLPVAAEPESLRRALVRVYGGVSQPGAADPTLARLRAGRDGRPAEADDAVAICDELLQAAALRQASDIHLLPREGRTQVLLRVDGRLESYRDLSAELQGAVVSRLKVLAGLDIAEKRAPQDGRFTARIGPAQTKIDIRTATLPTRFGERVTLRLLAAHGSHLSLESLGMTADDLGVFRTAIQRPHGLVLLTGPTGSGKSTTLYAALAELLSTRGGNVITVEDPIEYEMSGVSQVEVDSADKVNFSRALRSLLRHDPDVVMIGEIRDDETAAIAIKAALTGHLVFSTLHTNTAAGVVTRLVDMGMQRFLVAATLRLSVAQRLVRRLCPHCRAAPTPDDAGGERAGEPDAGRSFRVRAQRLCLLRGARIRWACRPVRNGSLRRIAIPVCRRRRRRGAVDRRSAATQSAAIVGRRRWKTLEWHDFAWRGVGGCC